MTFISPFVNPFSSPFEDTFSSLLYQLRFSYDKLGRTAGNTTHSNTRTAIATVVDFEGVLRTAKAGETRVEGARRVENLATALTTHSVTVAVDRIYQISTTGDNASTVVLSGAATGTLTNDGSVQQGFDTAKTATTTTLTLTITGTLTGLLVEDVTGQAVTAPSDIIAFGSDHGWGANGVVYYDYQNGNTISGGAVTSAKGVAISSGIRVLAEPTATNAVVNSGFTERTGDDFDDWTEAVSGSTTISAETTDLPLGFDCGVRFDVDGSGSNCYIQQSERLNVGAGEVATISGWVQAANASGLSIQVRADDGAGGSLEYLSADGSAWQAGSDYFNPSDLPTSWDRWSFVLPPTNTGRTHVRLYQIRRNVGSSVSHRFTGLQIEDKEGVTSYINTTTAALTRDRDAITFDNASTWFPGAEGFSLLRVTPQLDWATNSAVTYWLTAAPSGNLLAYRNGLNDGVRAYDGTNVPTILAGHTPGSAVTIATIWSTALNQFQIGYYKHQEGTWHWDPTPTAYAGFTSTILSLIQSLNDVEKVAGVKIYSGLPESTLAATQTWIENNAVDLIG